MKYPSLTIAGNIITADIIEKLEQETLPGQSPKDFNLGNQKLRDAIGSAWADANDYYRIFKRKIEQLAEDKKGTTETRDLWLKPLMMMLGYQPDVQSASREINHKNYFITHTDGTHDEFPEILISWRDSLDKKPERRSMSAHAEMQEYLNVSEHTYGIISNGRQIRLLRNSGRISRLSYVEWDLERIFEESLYPDFALLFRLLHGSRMPARRDTASESVIEQYHLVSLSEGTRIRGELSAAVKNSLKAFGKGLISHPANAGLRTAIENKEISANDFYQELLRLIYRLLFLMVIEEKENGLVYAHTNDSKLKRLRDIYYNYYSMQRLRRLADKKHLVQPKKTDLWIALKQLFVIYRDKRKAAALGLQPLGGDLFGREALYHIEQCQLDNGTLLDCLYKLTWFLNRKTGQMQRVNYGALNVEEFGSVYEGLLELTPAFIWPDFGENPIPSFGFPEDDTGDDERHRSGSHYTPEELVQPLIKHSLDYLLADRKKIIVDVIKQRKLTGSAHAEAREALVQQHIYSLKVCDVACGSGHILISAARRIAEVAAGIIEEEEQPNPVAYRKAKREAIRHCIYGVDKNLMAVELCKVALWLESHNPGDSLSFLDHHIKNGDAIVGLARQEELERGIADEAFKQQPGDDKDIAKLFRDRNKEQRANKGQGELGFEQTAIDDEVKELLAGFKQFSNVKEHDADDYAVRKTEYNRFTHSRAVEHLKAAADLQLAQFFIPKTKENKPYLCTDADYRKVLKGEVSLQSQYVTRAVHVEHEQRKFFHWFLEFPEVFSEGGFDCILGNPPYLGGSKISTSYGSNFSHCLLSTYANVSGMADLVSYFFKRDFGISKPNSFTALITTDSIAQGITKTITLDELIQKGSLVFAIRSMQWPGDAAVNIAIISFYKGHWKGPKYIGNHQVNFISSLLTDSSIDNTKYALYKNKNIAYTGSKVYGEGFVLSKDEAATLIAKDKKNETVIKPYLTGDDIVNNWRIEAPRYVINFYDWPLEKEGNNSDFAENYPDCIRIIRDLVKPERDKLPNNNPAKKKWWQYERPRKELYENIASKELVLIMAQTAKYIAPTFCSTEFIFSVKVIVFDSNRYSFFSLLQSSFHNEWVWLFGTKMGSSTLQYSTSACFDPFPMIQTTSSLEQKLEKIGKTYHDLRVNIMFTTKQGLTDVYNLFHSRELVLIPTADEAMDDKTFEKKYGKDGAGLKKHLAKTPGTCIFNEAVQGIIKLRALHVEMDNAVLEAYGWKDILLRHDFYDVDYLPENDRTRYTIHPDARKEVLKRLLDLNHKIHEEEEKAGQLGKKGGKKEKKGKVGKEKKEVEGQKELF